MLLRSGPPRCSSWGLRQLLACRPRRAAAKEASWCHPGDGGDLGPLYVVVALP